MKIHKLSAYGLGAFVVTFGATLAFGQARVPFTRPPYIVTPGDITANGDLTVGADNTDSKVCFDGPACVNKIDVTQSNDFMTAWSNSSGVWTATPSFFYVYKQLMAQQPVVSLMASGSQSFSCANLGCRLNLGSTARYLVDDGTNLEFVAPVQATKVETTNTTPNTPAVTVASDTQVCLDGATCSVNLKYNSGSTRAELTYGGTSTLVVGAAGVRVTNTTLVADTSIDLPALVRLRNTATTIADSGGAGAASHTQSVYNVGVRYTCNDADGCNVTMSEVSAIDGYTMTFTNESANTVNFTDTAGVTELAGNFAMGQYDTLTLRYVNDRWVELSRSNN